MQAEIVPWETEVTITSKGCVFCQVQAIVRDTMARESSTRVNSAHRQETSLTVCFRAICDRFKMSTGRVVSPRRQ